MSLCSTKFGYYSCKFIVIAKLSKTLLLYNKYMYCCTTALFLYKSLNSILPAFLQNLFIYIDNKHSYATRQYLNLYVPRSKTNLCTFSINITDPQHGTIILPILDFYNLYIFSKEN